VSAIEWHLLIGFGITIYALYLVLAALGRVEAALRSIEGRFNPRQDD